MKNERRSNEDYLQEVWDSLESAWNKDKFDMSKGYDDEYGCECITISLRDNEDVRAKIYVEDHEGQHPTGFEVVYRYPGDKGVGIGGYYEFQSTDMDGLGEEVFDYFDEIKNKVGESMTDEKLFTLYDIHGNYPNFGKPSCWRDPQFWKDYEDYYSLAYPDVGIKITMKDDDSVDVTSNGEFIMNYSWKNGRHHATGADGSGFKHPGFGFRDDLSMLYRGTKGKEMGPYVPVYLDDAEQADESKQNEGKNEVSNFSRDSLGVSFDGKFGNMRKGESWVVYPETLDKGYICIQGDTRFGYINVNKGFLVLSAPHSTPIYASLMVDINKGKAQRIPLEKEIVDQILNAVNDRTITDHSLDNVIRNADVTDDELKGEAKKCEDVQHHYDRLNPTEKEKFNGLSEQIETLVGMYDENGDLSKPQQDQLKELRDTIYVFGYVARGYVSFADEVLANYGVEPLIDSKEPVFDEARQPAEYSVHSYNDTDIQHYEDGTPEEWRCQRCGGLNGGEDGEPFGKYITDSNGKVVIRLLCSGCADDACDILNATHGNVRKAIGLGESKKSESLTLKQKELKDMARFGQAEDITTISDAEAKELKKKGIETVGISRGVYGMNGALLRDKDGNKYVITARSSNLFYFV